MTAGLVIGIMNTSGIGFGGMHVGPSGDLENALGEPVGTAAVVELRDGTQIAGMTQEELKSVRVLELGSAGGWSAYHVASVHRVGVQSVRFVALDGTEIAVNGSAAPVIEAPGGSVGGRLLGLSSAPLGFDHHEETPLGGSLNFKATLQIPRRSGIVVRNPADTRL